MDRLRLFVSCRPAVRTGRAGASTRCSTQGTRRAPARPPSDTEHRGGEVARRAICDGPMLGSATQRRRVGADPISFWGTFRCKRPNSTLAASSGFDQPLMIVLASSRILELGARSWKDCRRLGRYRINTAPFMSRLSWKWRERSAGKITERRHDRRLEMVTMTVPGETEAGSAGKQPC